MPALKRIQLIANNRSILFLCFLLANFFAIKAHAQFGIINTIAGTGTPGYTGDGGQATVAELNFPLGLWVDPGGNIYIADTASNVIRMVTPAGIISTVAGNGTPGFGGDGGPAVSAMLNRPTTVCMDAAGNLFIADYDNNRIRKVSGGIITTVVGNGTPGFFGDAGPATSAELDHPFGVWVDGSENIIFTDLANHRVREVNGGTGIISTIAGTGVSGFCCDGSLATLGSFTDPAGICEDPGGIIYFCTQAGDARVRKIDLAGIIHTEMGDGIASYGGDCGPATTAEIEWPQTVASDAAGNIYLATEADYRIRVVDAATGIIHTVAGDGSAIFSGDGGSPLSAGMDVFGVALDAAGNIYISGNNRVRKVTIALHNDTVSTFCLGDSAVLGSATTFADSLRWNTGATTSSITVHTPGIYWVNIYVCTYVTRDSFVVPGCLHPVNNGPLCPGDTLKLQAIGDSTNATYFWYGPGMFTSTLQNPVIPHITASDSGVYHVVKTVDGVTDTATTDVVVKPLPVVTAGSNSPVCSGIGDTIMLTASPDSTGETFTWTGPNGFSSTLQNPFIVAPLLMDQGLYKVVTVLNACKDSGSVFVVVDSTPVAPVAGSNAPICSQRDTLKFTATDATSGVSFSWSGPLGFTSSLQNPVILPNVHVPASGAYTLTATLLTVDIACTSRDTIAIVVDSTPSLPVLGSNSPVCSGNPLLLTASGTMGANYSWNGPNLFTSALQNPTINPAPTIASGTYTAFAKIIYPGIPGGCISDTATLSVEVDSTPALPLASSNSPGAPGPTRCEGDTLQLTAFDTTAGVSYSWIGPGTFTSTNENPLIIHATSAATGSYTVTVTLGGCNAFAIISVSITPTPPLTATNNGPICTGVSDTLLLQAYCGPGATYSWAGPYTFSSLNQNPYRTPVVYEYGGVYQVTAFLDGCPSDVVNDTVIVRQTPAPPIVAWLTYCQFYPASPLQAMGDSILWYPTDTAHGVGSLVPPVPSTTEVGVSWFYTSQTLMSCTSYIDSIKVAVNPKPIVTVSDDTAICPHDSVTLTAIDTDPLAYYHWSPSIYLTDTSSAAIVAKPETNVAYTVVASNQFGCSDTAHVTITVESAAVLNLGDSVTLYPGESYQLDPQTNCTSFTWFPPAGLDNAHVSSPVASPQISTIYTVRGETSWGCITDASISIYVNSDASLVLPNAFSPGSSANSEFKIIKRGIVTLQYFRVFDRWGVKVFETTNIDQGWDGTFNGTPQPFGVYVYEVGAITNTGSNFEKHGNVTLIR